MLLRHAVLRRALRAVRPLVVAGLLATLVSVVLPGSAPSEAAVARAAGSSSDYRVAIPGYRWASCKEIGWKYNPAGQPVQMLPVLKEAFRKVARRTGLRFRYEGTSVRSAARYSGRVAATEVLISWATEQQASGLAGSRVGVTRTYADPVTHRYRSAAVVFDRLAVKVGPGFTSAGRATWGQIALHEIGHVIGLGHASGSSQLMNKTLGSQNHAFGAGDLAGFRRLGRLAECPAA